MLGALLPAGAYGAEETGDPEPAGLFPEEAALVARATPGRRREFTTARLCAHRALAALGMPRAPLLRGWRGAPAWPAGTVGGLTHCAGFRGAAVAPAARFLALGIDAEPHAPLPPGVCGAVAFGPEPARLRELAARRPDIAWDRLLFSAKESVYKAWSGYGGAWLGFEDAEVAWEAAPGEDPHPAPTPYPYPSPSPEARTSDPATTGRFRARLLVPPPEPSSPGTYRFPSLLHGRWLVRDGLLLTSVAVPRPVPRPHPHQCPHPSRTAPKESAR
ncbi:4'-phosphopantetheinyl transferase [Streptomyces sp. NPDC088757]|uniref:4'-phosphopantetheinyl transferase family protein n=1 Tax=Streptomyces sp. NPDC088757 TaxID=3365889 RepID=UPI0037F4D3B9